MNKIKMLSCLILLTVLSASILIPGVSAKYTSCGESEYNLAMEKKMFSIEEGPNKNLSVWRKSGQETHYKIYINSNFPEPEEVEIVAYEERHMDKIAQKVSFSGTQIKMIEPEDKVLETESAYVIPAGEQVTNIRYIFKLDDSLKDSYENTLTIYIKFKSTGETLYPAGTIKLGVN